MANKAFEIQESKLRIGGLDLEAGATAIVVPGFSQAVTYFVEEVDERDGNNPDTFGNNVNSVTVIDNAEYLVLSGTTPSASYTAAEYSVDELDDGEINEINVEAAGVFEAADKTRAEAGTMWATTVSSPFDNFNTNEWTQIPFRPKIRAGEVTNVGGTGTGNLDSLDDVQLEDLSDGQVLTWNDSQETWENRSPTSSPADMGDFKISDNILGTQGENGIGWGYHSLNLDPGGESSAYISIPSMPMQENGQPLTIWNTGDNSSQINLTANSSIQITVDWSNGGGKVFEFSSNGALRLPAGGDILNSSGQSVLGGGSNSYTPDDTDNWNDPTVNTIQAALDELAARVVAIQNFEIDGGNAYTPAAGETIIDGNGA